MSKTPSESAVWCVAGLLAVIFAAQAVDPGGAAEVVNFKYEGSRFEVSSRVRDEAGAARLQLGAAGAAKQEGEGGGRGMGRGQGSKSGGA